MKTKTSIPWKSTIDINTTRNLFSYSNVKLPYEIEFYICSCGEQNSIIKQAKQELEAYQCSECGNEIFYDAIYYLSNHAWYENIEKLPFYDMLQDNLKIEMKYDTNEDTLLLLLNIQIPNFINLSSEKIKYHNKTIYTLLVNKNSKINEQLMVKFDLESLYHGDFFSGINDHHDAMINKLLYDFKEYEDYLMRKACSDTI